MNKEKFMECERNRLEKILNFRLPHSFKYIGAIIAIVSFLTFFLRLALPEHKDVIKTIGRTGLIIGLLVISLSRDKHEDERTIAIKSQSYAIAFVLGVAYALIMPYVEYGVSNAINNEGDFKSLGDFQVLSFMLMVQLGFYYTMKRYK